MGLKIVRFFSRAYAGGWVRGGILGVWVCALLLVGGCGLIEESESTSYHIPNWTSDGEIIALKRWMKHRKTLISNSEPIGFRETVVLMDAHGENERELFRVELGSPKLLELSPQGNYIGLIDGAVLLLYDRDGNVLAQINPDPDVTHIKFSPDETMLYGSKFFAGMSFFSVPDLALLSSNELGGGGVWKNNDELLVYHRDLGGLGVYNFLNSTMTHLFAFSVNQVAYVSSENILFSLGASEIYSYELGAENYTEEGISWAPYEYGDFTGQHLSPDGGKVVMGAKGPESEGTGIFVLDATGDLGVTRLR